MRLALIGAGVMISTYASAFINHSVQRGETLWGLAHKYNVSADDIVKFNPTLKTGLKTGQNVRIPEASDLAGTESSGQISPMEKPDEKDTDISLAEEDGPTSTYRYEPAENNGPSNVFETGKTINGQSATPTNMGAERYVARFGDTFKSVSAKTGVSENQLIALNPLVDGSAIAEGEVIRLTAEAPYSTTRTDLSKVDSIVYRITPVDMAGNSKGKEAVVAVMLPFELSQGEVSRQALLATDFYKGFLLATKDNQRNIGYDLRLYAIDTSDESVPLQKSLQTLVDEGVNVVIPPDDDHQIAEIERFCDENGISVFNVLNIKDEGYLSYPDVVQGNINQKMMYDKAIEALSTLYPDHIPVILNLAGGKEDKSGFTEELKKQYRERGLNVRELTFTDYLKESDIESLPSDKKYIFIPKSGSQEVFDKISDAIASKIESDLYPQRLKLFGYPDWVALRGQSEEALHRIGAVIYSRFNYNGSDNAWDDINSKFKQWYGTTQIEVFPSQGTLGYDAGCFLLKMLDAGWPEQPLGKYTSSYSGMQSAFRLEQHEDGGLINDSLYIIEFLPGSGTYSKVM